MSTIQEDKLKLINFSISTIEKLLIEYDEYFPVATIVKLDGEVVPVLYSNGGEDEQPLSSSIIDSYQEIVNEKIKNKEIRSYAIAYDVNVTRDNETTDAIAIKIEHIEMDEVVVYYYPYRIVIPKAIEIGKGWGEVQD